MKPKSAMQIDMLLNKGIEIGDLTYILTYDNADRVLSEMATLFDWSMDDIDSHIENIDEETITKLNYTLKKYSPVLTFNLFKEQQKELMANDKPESWLKRNTKAIISIFIAITACILTVLLFIADIPEKNEALLQNVLYIAAGYFIPGLIDMLPMNKNNKQTSNLMLNKTGE